MKNRMDAEKFESLFWVPPCRWEPPFRAVPALEFSPNRLSQSIERSIVVNHCEVIEWRVAA